MALPTGSGKSLCISDFTLECNKRGLKVLNLSHVKEIIEQNEKSLKNYTKLPIAVNSSGLDRREVGDITVAGIQSVFRNPERFKDYEIVIIDECHLVSHDEDTMYRKFINGLTSATVVGFTATPFRLGTGYIYGSMADTMFDELVLNWCTEDKFNQLVKEGYLCKLTTKRTELEMDTSGVKLIGGDFSEASLSSRFDREIVTNEAIKEILQAGINRKKWLIFAIDIKHAEHIAETLIRNGISTAVIHSKMQDYGYDRDRVLRHSKEGIYKAIVNVNILTTGYDDPEIDLIAMLRPTCSPVLHVQTLGRGCRISEGKDNCLVLDFAGNTARLGPINNVLVKKAKKGDGGGEPITKTCPNCSSILAPAVRFCPDCNHEFIFEHNLESHAANLDIIEDGNDHWVNVNRVLYEENIKIGAPSSITVTYICAHKRVKESICIEHKGFAKHKADHWVKFRGGLPCDTTEDFMLQSSMLSVPTEILVKKKGKYYEIKNSNF